MGETGHRHKSTLFHTCAVLLAPAGHFECTDARVDTLKMRMVLEE